MDPNNPEYGLMGWSLEDHGWLYLCASLYDTALGGHNSTVTTRKNLISNGIQHATTTNEIYMRTLDDGAYNTSGIAAWWKLDEVQGNTIYDFTSFSHVGTLHGGVARVDGKFGKALQFFGATDYVTIDNYVGDMPSSSLDLTGPMTIEAWVYPTAFSGVNRIITKDGDNYVLRLENGKPHFYIKTGTLYHARSNITLPLNSWTDLAVTWADGGPSGDRYLRIYSNGTEVAQYNGQDWTHGTINISSGGVTLSSGGSEAFIGKIDQVREWSRKLLQPELRSNFLLGLDSHWIKDTSNSLTADVNFRAAELIYTFMVGGFSSENALTLACVNLFLSHTGIVPGYPGTAFGRPSWSNTETHSDCLAACLRWQSYGKVYAFGSPSPPRVGGEASWLYDPSDMSGLRRVDEVSLMTYGFLVVSVSLYVLPVVSFFVQKMRFD
jgi:hypothetical protein